MTTVAQAAELYRRMLLLDDYWEEADDYNMAPIGMLDAMHSPPLYATGGTYVRSRLGEPIARGRIGSCAGCGARDYADGRCTYCGGRS